MGEIPLDVRARTAAPASQRSLRLSPHAPQPRCLRPPTASDDPSKRASQRPAPTLRSPGGATTQTEKSTPVHTSNPSSAGGRSSPCCVPSADERRLSLPHRAAGLLSPPRLCSTSTGPVRRPRAPTPRAMSAKEAQGFLSLHPSGMESNEAMANQEHLAKLREPSAMAPYS